MSFYLCPLFQGVVQFTDDVGQPLANGQIFTYTAGTTTPTVTATSKAGTANNPNPILLDSTGRLTQEIWLIGGTSYKFVVTDSEGVQVGQTFDSIQGINDTTGIFNPINVINAINSADTQDAGSANAVRWAYNHATDAYNEANTAMTEAAAAMAAANTAGVSVYDSGVFVYTAKGLNFQNTAGVNFSTTANGTLVDIKVLANATTQNASANGYTTLPGGIALSWGIVSIALSGEAGPYNLTFVNPFPISGFFATVIPNGGVEPIAVSAVSKTGCTFSTGYTGGNAGQATVSYFAIGN